MLKLGVLRVTLFDQRLLFLKAGHLLRIGSGRAGLQRALGRVLLVAAREGVVGRRDSDQRDSTGQNEHDGQGLADGRLADRDDGNGSH